jgi:dGTPase
MDSILLERLHDEPPPSPRDHRHPTERDRDRILHSSAFRRLQGKTQVFGIGQADFYRTRLTHSIETAQIARAIANNLIAEEARLNGCLIPELAEAVALAHDLGHPPFGHGGEQTLDACMGDVSRRFNLRGRRALRFEGNAQTFHILVAVEPKSPAYPGLNLTRATLAGVVKYPFEQDTANHRFIFTSDSEQARWALEGGSQLISARQRNAGVRPRTAIVCQILDWADDCAYSIHDIEDALQARFLRASDLSDARFCRRVAMHYDERCESEAVPRLALAEVRDRLNDFAAGIRPPDMGDERAHRKQALRDVLNELITSVGLARRPGRQRADFSWDLVVPAESRILSVLCKSVVWEAVITDPRVAAMITKGKEILHDLFYLLLEELVVRKSCNLFPRYYRPIAEECLQKGELESARGVCNFLALLTDQDALRLHSLLKGAKVSSIFDLL